MFASTKVKLINSNKNYTKEEVLNEILLVYKKLKEIARKENEEKISGKIAELTPEQIGAIRQLESRLSINLIAYENPTEVNSLKVMVLNKVKKLLEEYLIITCENYKSVSIDDFNAFFEQ